jgi:hypothetical protein
MFPKVMTGPRKYVVMVMFFAAACSPPAAPDSQPTQMLVPPTVTSTSIPVSPTVVTTQLPRPGDISTIAPTSEMLEATPIDDIIAAELVGLAQRRLSQEFDVPVRRIRVLELTRYTWPDTSLGCPAPGETYPIADVEGYRIVLAINDEQYIFHTDFDRVIGCDPANEQLPQTSAS